ncbi:HipA domain-containing protein [Geobacter pelophilus]|uniref:HipA domain-containing protein n=1 Tax=Geoanaerobacter pelophilus TaxID=60036 RepID=A0AAW4L1V9_9BACT|nr:type II toxin-antitoxin system HipA family toxin [Geoanaerobacter pelophilus]MBT0664908.1 HipA domain-containing protein [Geoanaerobacter pelophilus]
MTPQSLAVWNNGSKVGILGQNDNYFFNYLPDTPVEHLVSLTMPYRLQSWVSDRELHPIFQMNLPEGALREAIRNAFAKVVVVDDIALLRITGGNQIGRNRFSLPDSEIPMINEKPESLDEILTYPDAVELFNELMARHAEHSGISGVQPKVIVEATERTTVAASSYIVKSWGNEYPQLAANEYFCMTAAKLAGLSVPDFSLSENGGLFVMKRFDTTVDGENLGFEDFCSLQALGTDKKYDSTYERVARTIKDFVSPEHLSSAREQFFATLVLSAMVRNGDAHLKNFGVLYRHPQGPVSLAPVYDIVTTTAYLQKDVPALHLAGTKKWWSRKILERFALQALSLPAKLSAQIIDRVAEAVIEASKRIPPYIRENPDFEEIGSRMLPIWQDGVDAFAASERRG